MAVNLGMLRMRAGFSWSMRGGCISHWRGLSQSFAPLADSGKAQQLPPEDRGQQDQPQRLLPPEGEDFLASTDIERLIRSDFKEVHGMGSRLFVMFPRCEGREGGLTVLMCAPLCVRRNPCHELELPSLHSIAGL